MPFTPKDWKDANTSTGGGNETTPLNAAALEDLETRVSDYTDTANLVALVTSLPGSPTDGQVIYYDTGTAGVIWQLRYNSSASGSYKWEFIGGPALSAEVTTQEGTTSTTYTDLTTSGPAVTLPLAGDYDVAIGCWSYNNTNGGGTRMSYAIGATAAVAADSIYHLEASTTNTTTENASRKRRKTGLSAVTLTAKYHRAFAGTATFQDRWLEATPVRVG